jgi:RNA recognition motif-containing protein
MSTVFAGNLSFKLSAQELAEAFEKYGTVKECRILTRGRGRTRRSRGCGFVEFERQEDAERAISDREPMVLREREIQVDVGHGSEPVTDTIFVANLGPRVTRDVLMRFFAAYRPIDARIVCTKESDSRKGFGYVQVPSQEQRDAAIERLNDQELDGEHLVVEAARRSFLESEEVAERRSRREARLLRRDEGAGIST